MGLVAVLEEVQRPLTEAERRQLEKSLEGGGRSIPFAQEMRDLAVWTGASLLLTALFAIGGFGIERPEMFWRIPGGVLLGGSSICGFLCLYILIQIISGIRRNAKEARRFAREDKPKIRAALEHGQAKVVRVTSDEVIVVEEQEYVDEGSAYIYGLGDGRSFYLRGQHCYPKDRPAPWPARRFEIANTAIKDIWLGIRNVEGSLEPKREIPMEETPEGFAWSDDPKSESVLAGSPEEVLSRLTGYNLRR